MFSFIIDNREQQLKNLLVTKNFSNNIIFDNINIGDIVIEYNNEIYAVFERKTILDLISSIKDQRYKNQKNKLLSTNCNQLYYIIEGNFNFDNSNEEIINGISKNILIGCIINTLIRDNIKIFFTKDINDTFSLLYEMFKRLEKDPEKYIDKNATKITYNVIKTKKIETKEECFINILCQIPSISNKSAKSIISLYSSYRDLYENLKDKKFEEIFNIFKNIKLNKKQIENIIEYLL